MHVDAFSPVKTPRVLFIDDLIATGGTAEASLKLIKAAGGEVVESCFLIELNFLEGRKKIEALAPCYSVLGID